MRLPWRRTRRPFAQRDTAVPPDEPVAGPRVLVCDDNESVTQVLEMMLSLEGWTVEVTRTGPECLAAMDRAEPDVVVLDQRMPGMSGLEVAATARETGFDRPILLFSGHLAAREWASLGKLALLPVNKLDCPAVVRHVTVARRQYEARMRQQSRRPAE
jgi:CheY-like chemotaxis protein